MEKEQRKWKSSGERQRVEAKTGRAFSALFFSILALCALFCLLFHKGALCFQLDRPERIYFFQKGRQMFIQCQTFLDASSHLYKRVCPSVRMSVNIHEIPPESAQSSLKHCGCIPNHYGRIYLPTRACLFYLSFGQTAVTWPKLP